MFGAKGPQLNYILLLHRKYCLGPFPRAQFSPKSHVSSKKLNAHDVMVCRHGVFDFPHSYADTILCLLGNGNMLFFALILKFGFKEIHRATAAYKRSLGTSNNFNDIPATTADKHTSKIFHDVFDSMNRVNLEGTCIRSRVTLSEDHHN